MFLAIALGRVYIHPSMSGHRAPGQKLLTLPAKEEFRDLMDAHLGRCGYSNRAQFVRDAISEKLERAGISVPRELTLPPGRTWRSDQSIPLEVAGFIAMAKAFHQKAAIDDPLARGRARRRPGMGLGRLKGGTESAPRV